MCPAPDDESAVRLVLVENWAAELGEGGGR